MAIGCWASPGKGGALCRSSISARGFCGNLIRTHLGGRLEAGLNWNNPDPKQRENNLPKSLGEMIPAEQLPRVGVCGQARGLSLRGGGQLSTLGELQGLLVGEETAREALDSRPRPGSACSPCVVRFAGLRGRFVSAQEADPGFTGCMPGTILANLILTVTPVRKALWLPPGAVRLLMSLESNWFRPQSYCVQSWNLNQSLRVSSWPVLPESSSWPLRGLPLLTCARTEDTVDALGALALLLGAPWCPGDGIVQTGARLPSRSLCLLQFIEETKVLSFFEVSDTW